MEATAGITETMEPPIMANNHHCKKTMVKKKRIFISIAFCDFVLWNSDRRNLGLIFPSSCFSGQNGMFSATEQNQTYKNSFFL